VTTIRLSREGHKWRGTNSRGIPLANGLVEEDKSEEVTRAFCKNTRRQSLSSYLKNN
jgi:hypothetical protein